MKASYVPVGYLMQIWGSHSENQTADLQLQFKNL